MHRTNIYKFLIVVTFSFFFLGSSVTFCETGNIYNKSYDLSDSYISRWEGGKAQATPHWTQDGSHIVFGHAGRIYVVDAKGSDLRSLSGSFKPVGGFSQTKEIDFSPSVAPDGSRVAYTTLRYAEGELSEHSYEIATQALDGSDRRRLTFNESNDISPSWSPDGSRIAFISHRGGAPRVFTIAPDGSDEHIVAPSVEVSHQPPVWSPDGKRLAFLAIEREPAQIPYLDTYYSRENPTPGVVDGKMLRYLAYVAEADGSGLTKMEWANDRSSSPRQRIGIQDLILPEEFVSTLAWSSDGQRLAFAAAFYGDPPALYSISADGTGLRRIFGPEGDVQSAYPNPFETIYDVSWTPSGEALRFNSRGLELQHDNAIRRVAGFHVAEHGGLQSSVALHGSPSSIDRGHTQWSPDGNRIAIHNNGFLYTTAPDGTDQRNLVRSVEGQLAAGLPILNDASQDAEKCSDGSVVPWPWWKRGLVEDCRVLLSIRDELAGDETLNWSSKSPVRDWPGVKLAGTPPRVHEITSIPNVTLNGAIPPAIGKLTELRTLNLEDNELTGELPHELANLSKLEVLDVGDWWAGHNNLTGRIPPELGDLSNLRILDLSGNSFEGTIPPELGNLGNLTELHLFDNPLGGDIPPELGQLTNLRKLDLGGNRSELEGNIPPEIGNLRYLQELTIKWTEVSGPIPPELGNLSHLREIHLQGSGGKLNGPIPPELGQLQNLAHLDLENNRLTGQIPAELGNLWEEVNGSQRTRLGYLNLGRNRLTGCIPPRVQMFRPLNVDLPVCDR